MKVVDITNDAFSGAIAQLIGEVLERVKRGNRSFIAREITANGNRIRLSVDKIQEDDDAA